MCFNRLKKKASEVGEKTYRILFPIVLIDQDAGERKDGDEPFFDVPWDISEDERKENEKMRLPEGKGMFIWKTKDAEGGDGAKAAQKAFDGGYTHVIIKVLDGIWKYNQRRTSSGVWKDDILKPFIEEFQKRGIEVYGYQWLYLGDWGSSPIAEADRAAERIAFLGLDGFVMDVEANCKNKPKQSRVYVNRFKTKGIEIPVALSSYRFPTYHREISYQTFLEISDVVMPQVYWIGSSNPAEQLARTLEEWRDLTALPIIPTGAAFAEHGWTATAGQVLEFLDAAFRNPNIQAANFWVWNHAVNLGLWNFIAEFPWIVDDEPNPILQVDWESFLGEYVYQFMVDRGYTGPKPIL